MQGDQLQKTKVSYDSKASTVQMIIDNYKVTLHFQADAPSKCLWHFFIWSVGCRKCQRLGYDQKRQERHKHYEESILFVSYFQHK